MQTTRRTKEARIGVGHPLIDTVRFLKRLNILSQDASNHLFSTMRSSKRLINLGNKTYTSEN
jgi:hypothetical protein